MTRVTLAVCTGGAFALLLAGCASTDVAGLLLLKSGPNGERVVTGNIQAVAMSTQRSLAKFGMSANITPKGEEIWIASQTKLGMKFNVVLSSEKTPQGVERTHVRLVWDSQRDDRMGASVVADVEAQHRS